MLDDTAAAASRRDKLTRAHSLERLFRLPLPPPQMRIRPRWFPAQELRDPLVSHLKARQADAILGPDLAIIPEMQGTSQALLTVNIVDSGNLVEITVFGQPSVQNRVKSALLGLAWFHRERRAGAEKMKHLEENSKAGPRGSHTAQHPIA
ncbi:PREDICTED: oocyte-expressed protein homolog [Propithecus coquereli]|uniref:oocyte-expressed protein homolog n=1 Tax=Propithecus coquereli TaxID=379532 RepID=UPI00063FB9B6|nr:PREDICTED: oocyte-expressed protein homolog [Propithecus coquereli]